MSENIYAGIGYVDDIPMPKLAQPAALFSLSPRVRDLARKLRGVAHRA